MTDRWPLWGLTLTTPRLELRPDDDAGLDELVCVARAGVHPPDTQPFSTAWTDNLSGLAMRRHFWQRRAEFGPARWTINFLVRHNGRVIGMQALSAKDFSARREVTAGMWLGREYQRQGFGTEMYAAVLALAFDWFDADCARAAAMPMNTASLKLHAKLGFEPNGSDRLVCRGERVDDVRLLLRRNEFRRPDWELDVHGLHPCLPLLWTGADDE